MIYLTSRQSLSEPMRRGSGCEIGTNLEISYLYLKICGIRTDQKMKIVVERCGELFLGSIEAAFATKHSFSNMISGYLWVCALLHRSKLKMFAKIDNLSAKMLTICWKVEMLVIRIVSFDQILRNVLTPPILGSYVDRVFVSIPPILILYYIL